MPYLFTRFVLALVWFCALPCGAALPGGTAPLVLDDQRPSGLVASELAVWLDPSHQTDIAQASAQPQRFVAAPALQRHPLDDQSTLWVQLRLERAAHSTSAWTLNVPLPSVDAVTLYQRQATGGWSVQSAGDQLAPSRWSTPGLYPEFDLELPPGVPQEVYLQVRNFKHLSLPIRLASQPQRAAQRLQEVAALGLMLGALLALSGLSVVRYLEHGNRCDLWAALYGLLLLLTVAQLNGMLNLLVWAHLPQGSDYASSVLPVVAVGATLLFVHQLYALSTPARRYDRLLRGTAWLTMGWALGYAVVDHAMADAVGNALMLLATGAGLATAVLAWRGQSPLWRWLVLAYVPPCLGLLRLLAEALGLLPTWWEMRYVASLSVTLSVPLLMYALKLATHDRKELTMRANDLATQDALTGLLTPQAFHTHLQNAYERAVTAREPMALVLVKVVNLEHLRQTLGGTVAEQCLLRAVVKLHRVLRDVDPAGRVDTAHFALLYEGMASREALTARMVQLVASGLTPLPGLTPPVHLQFQVACVMLHENPVAPDSVLAQLDTVLNGMSFHTRRPIRFLEPVPTQPGAL